MAFLTFRGGVHPYDGKELVKRKACTGIFSRKRNGLSAVTAYRSSGAACCEKGRLCSGGTENAEREALFLHPIHSSVSGVVKELKKVRNNVGAMVDAIVIENDEK